MLPLSWRLLARSEHHDLSPTPRSPRCLPLWTRCAKQPSVWARKMAARCARRKRRKMNKVWRKGLHSPGAPTELEHLCFSSPLWMLCKCQRLMFGMRARRYLWSVYAAERAAGPAGYWYIVQLNGSWSRYYHPVNAAGILCHTRRNWPIDLFCEVCSIQTFIPANFMWTF